eukprot:COSAG04_NODE_4868_length_1852_cov_1.523103_3_plen_80_part_01
MEGREWSLCCSTFEGCDTAAKFHAACDAHTPTLTVARNAGGTVCTKSGYTPRPPEPGRAPTCGDGWALETNPGNFIFGGF